MVEEVVKTAHPSADFTPAAPVLSGADYNQTHNWHVPQRKRQELVRAENSSAVGTELGVENVFFGSLRWAVSKDCMAKTESLIVGRVATPGSSSPWCKWTRREPHIRTCGC